MVDESMKTAFRGGFFIFLSENYERMTYVDYIVI